MTRPWPVKALVCLSVVSLVFSLTQDDLTPWDIVFAALAIWITICLWAGRAWAFTFSFMVATLCAGGVLVVGLVGAFLMEQQISAWHAITFLIALGWSVLLVHPATKRFAGLARNDEVETSAARR